MSVGDAGLSAGGVTSWLVSMVSVAVLVAVSVGVPLAPFSMVVKRSFVVGGDIRGSSWSSTCMGVSGRAPLILA